MTPKGKGQIYYSLLHAIFRITLECQSMAIDAVFKQKCDQTLYFQLPTERAKANSVVRFCQPVEISRLLRGKAAALKPKSCIDLIYTEDKSASSKFIIHWALDRVIGHKMPNRQDNPPCSRGVRRRKFTAESMRTR